MLNWEIPYLTEALPGVGGVIRVEVEDFVVDEVPAYAPCGEGEHTYFGVEKRDVSTMALTREIARALGVSEREISSAGLKDARAIARQTLCVQWIDPEKIMALGVPKARILWAKRHTNKLRSGHLRGNRFTVRIRDVVPDAASRAEAIAATLLARGVPNGYGRQRFGNRGDNHEIGLLLLQNDRAGMQARGVHHISRKMRQFFVSAMQSSLFNAVLAERIRCGTMDGVLLGDVAKKSATGGLFTVEDVAVDGPRAKSWEISATGPIFGYKMMTATDVAGTLESQVLADSGMHLEAFRPFKARGSRRPLRYYPDGLRWEMEADDVLTVSFFAPKGAYATSLLRELMKVETVADREEND